MLCKASGLESSIQKKKKQKKKVLTLIFLLADVAAYV